MTTPDTAPKGPPGRLINYLIAVGIALTAGGIELFWSISSRNNVMTMDAITITVDGRACTPMALEMPAGKATFKIVNASDRPLEWEILDGVMVLAERENIAPGFSSSLTETLKPGDYEITCGLLSNPRGSLKVLPTAASEAARTAPPVAEFVGPLAERQVQLMRAASKFVQSSKALEEGLGAGDMVAAKAAWLAAAQDWARLGPVSLRVSDLTNRIAPQPEWLAGREADPGFTGLTRIEYALFKQGSTEGLGPVAAQLLADAEALQVRVKALKPAPEDVAGDAARQARALAEGQIAAGLSRHAGADGALLAAALEGLRRSMAAEEPMISAADPALAARLDDAFAAAGTAAQSTPYDPAAAAAALSGLADALGAINQSLSLES
ncbi:cupredoxin domain-containing protein [Rhodobacter maris]|uniref:Iron uptake system component EfeO n=1 Tax=Rhodobacter maris TaxID=446682 RepID=A0A285RM40_9RHOB|nr:cupredoxin domain-containing protein [Rhodobacter maris]SOB93387.1 iron uptake system component EfeO [Rhodobacter maris]